MGLDWKIDEMPCLRVIECIPWAMRNDDDSTSIYDDGDELCRGQDGRIELRRQLSSNCLPSESEDSDVVFLAK